MRGLCRLPGATVSPTGSFVDPGDPNSPTHFPKAADWVAIHLYANGDIATYESARADGSHVLLNFAPADSVKLTYGPDGDLQHGPLTSSSITYPSGYTVEQTYAGGHLTDYLLVSTSAGNPVRLEGHLLSDGTSTVSLWNSTHGEGNPLVASGIGHIDALIGQAGTGSISNDGASLIGQDGAGLVGQDGAGLNLGLIPNLIGQDEAGVIGQDGAGLLGTGFAGIFSGAHVLNDLGFVANTSGSDLVGNDGAGFAGNFLALAATGASRYSLAAFGDDADDYGETAATSGAIAIGGTVAGNLEELGDSDWFEARLTAGVTYVLSLKGADTGDGTLIDPYLRLYDSSGAPLAEVDDSGIGFNSRLTFTPTASGTYYLAAEGRSDASSGTYVISLATAGPPEPILGTSGNDNGAPGGRPKLFGTDAADTISGLEGDDILVGHGGNDTLLGGDGDDSLIGEAGNDTLAIGLGNKDEASGGAGIDTLVVDYSGVQDRVYYFVSTVTSPGETSTSYGIRGGINQVIYFGIYRFQVLGSATHNNNLSGGAGEDRLVGGAASDTLIGDGGDDIVDVGKGGAMAAVTGSDIANLGTGWDDLLIADYSAATEAITFAIHSGSAGAKDYFSNSSTGAQYGTTGKLAFTGVERFTVKTGSADDSVLTGDNADAISTGRGNDTLRASGGNDLLSGGVGTDALDGGAGRDTFVFGDALAADSRFGIDTIANFEDRARETAYDGLDRIELTAFRGANGGVALSFTDDLLIRQVGADTVIWLDLDGNDVADSTSKIILLGIDDAQIGARDFLL